MFQANNDFPTEEGRREINPIQPLPTQNFTGATDGEMGLEMKYGKYVLRTLNVINKNKGLNI